MTGGAAVAEQRLRDGRAVEVRPLREDDEAGLAEFGASLRRDDWRYLDLDLQSPATVTRLVTAHAASNWRQLVAVIDGRIVGYATVRQLPGWRSHVGDIHLVVSDTARGSGVGSMLAQNVLRCARDLGVEKVILEMIAEESAGRAIFEHLGFTLEGTLRAQAKDESGQLHDLLLFGLVLDA